MLFHNEHIPFSRTQGVMAAAAKAGVRIFPWVAEFVPDLSGLDGSRPHALSEFEQRCRLHRSSKKDPDAS